jgi:hypothetical protein
MTLQKEEIYKKLDFEFDRINKILHQVNDKYKTDDLAYIIKNFQLDHISLKEKISVDFVKTVNYYYYYDIYANIMLTEKNIIHNSKYKKNYNIIISNNGYRWIRIFGTNIERIEKSSDPNYYGDFYIIDEIEKFIKLVKDSQYLPFDDEPELVVIFYNLPNNEVKKEIESYGVIIKSFKDIPLDKITNYKKTCVESCIIDTTSLITLCSEICYIQYNLDFSIIKNFIKNNFQNLEEIIENKDNLSEEIKSYKNAYVCESVWNKFISLVEMHGGTKEKGRLNDIKNIVQIIKDNPTKKFVSSTINKKDANLFGTADYYKACVITGNKSNIDLQKFHINIKYFNTISLMENLINKK